MQYEWDPRKNERLKSERKVSFENIVFHLERGDVWMISDHPDQNHYPGQRIYFVIMDEYIYLVPHFMEENYIFLKTIIPSRKATKAYRSKQQARET